MTHPNNADRSGNAALAHDTHVPAKANAHIPKKKRAPEGSL